MTLESSNMQKRQKPFLSNRGKTNSQHFADVPNEDGASHEPHNYAVKGKKEAEGTVVVTNTALEDQVKDLSAKIELLTALIMAQQGASNEE